ncbi:ABC transporter ATP-binding protein [Desulfotomaculum copahuensis]|uniref:ABC transporter n=1 Tax=Desulfotomaculum copahuensis TaxID=1838280 RepID=A0A1B7LE37_9FIRM|nr:ABC transporter ATP-binding protein [Desulfotomaculum copahuensis]OAT81315.1 ABC transporter [Desulfotomaculum copahuensis]
MALFKIENLTYYYPGGEQPALKGINLSIEEGEFILVAGGSGSGKSSLARVLAGLLPDFYGGRFGGRVCFRGCDLRGMDRRKLAREVGMVFQDPEKQLVMTGMEAEIAFGLENLGVPRGEIIRRVAEVISFLGLADLRHEFTATLSGGQKQKLALAAVLAMQPQVLVLDEPTSQLDPVVAEDFLNLVKRLNEEMGFTVVLIEQRLERCYHLADRVVLMEGGRVTSDGPPEQVARRVVQKDALIVPPVARLFAVLGAPVIPVTVKEGRKLLRTVFPGSGAVVRVENGAGALRSASAGAGSSGAVRNEDTTNRQFSPARPDMRKERRKTTHDTLSAPLSLLEVKNLWFTYPNGREVLREINCRVCAGECVAVLGENGAGKSTLLKNMAGLLQPGRGRVLFMGSDWSKYSDGPGAHVAYLSQNPNDYLFQDSVEEELLFTLKNFGLADDGIVDELLARLHINDCRRVNPRDLSGGERQRVALAAVLVTRPELVFLDEPTRGMDYRLKSELGRFLKERADAGAGVVLVTHDVEFAAEYAKRVIMMFDGRLVADGQKHAVLGESVFYSTQAGKLCRGFVNGVLTFREALEKIGPAYSTRPLKEALL